MYHSAALGSNTMRLYPSSTNVSCVKTSFDPCGRRSVGFKLWNGCSVAWSVLVSSIMHAFGIFARISLPSFLGASDGDRNGAENTIGCLVLCLLGWHLYWRCDFGAPLMVPVIIWTAKLWFSSVIGCCLIYFPAFDRCCMLNLFVLIITCVGWYWHALTCVFQCRVAVKYCAQ